MFHALYVPMLLFEPARGCWYLSFGRAASAQTSMHTCAVSSEISLLSYSKYGPTIRALVQLHMHNCACPFNSLPTTLSSADNLCKQTEPRLGPAKRWV